MTTLSASPSKDKPILALCLIVNRDNLSGNVAPQFLLMFLPLGLLE